MSRDLYLIERRNEDGSMDFRGPQPETLFGKVAYQGIDPDSMAQVIYRHKPEAELYGNAIPA